MNAHLRLAAEHLERAADPSGDRETAEVLSAQFAHLAAEEGVLKELVPDKDDGLVLSPIAWAWFLPLLAESSLRPPDAVLDAIFERTASPFVRLRVVQAATATTPDDGWDRWLVGRARRSLGEGSAEHGAGSEAVVLGQILLQAGNRPAQTAFRALFEAAPPEMRRQLAQLVPPEAPDRAAWVGEEGFRE